MTTLHVQYCEHNQRLYEVIQRGEHVVINWTSADGTRTGVIGGLFANEAAAMDTLNWFCLDPLVARGVKS